MTKYVTFWFDAATKSRMIFNWTLTGITENIPTYFVKKCFETAKLQQFQTALREKLQTAALQNAKY